jgi:hypothetical protein
MAGQLVFVLSAALICIPRCVYILLALMTDQPCFYQAFGAGLALKLAYCAWRGERWAYYLLSFLTTLGLLISGLLLVAVHNATELILLVLALIATLAELLLFVVHPGVKDFMEVQRMRFKRSNT